MPTSSRASEAADLLWRHWTEGTVLEALPEAMRPATRADGYRIQALLDKRTRKPLYGWKIAATSKAGQAHIGVDGPLAGRLLAERVIADGGSLPLGHNRMRVAEAEFAFCMGRDLPPRATPYTVEEVLAAVDTLHPAIEIPDSRFVDFASVGGPQLIADDACAHYFVLGPATTADWRRIDLAAHTAKASIAGKLERDGIGANVLDDPRKALAWLANEVGGLGLTLRAGEVVTTGTCVVPLPIAPGDRIHVDLGVIGTVRLQIT